MLFATTARILCSLTAYFDWQCLVQSTPLFTGESDHAVSQLSFHPSDPDLLCTVGDSGLSLWHVDKHAGQSQLQQVPVQMSGGSKVRTTILLRASGVCTDQHGATQHQGVPVCVHCARATYAHRQHSTAQHSTAQHSTAQYSMGQHSTV